MALLLCERQPNWLRVITVVFGTIVIGLNVITSTFFYVFSRFFQNPKSRDFLRFFAVLRTFSRTMPVTVIHCFKLAVCCVAYQVSVNIKYIALFVVYICTWTLFSFYARHYVFTSYVTVCECNIALKATWLDLTWYRHRMKRRWWVPRRISELVR